MPGARGGHGGGSSRTGRRTGPQAGGRRRRQDGGQHSTGRGRGGDRQRPRPDAARATALEALARVRTDGAYANLLLPSLLDSARLGRLDAGFATALTYGTLRLRGRYDAILALCADRPLEELDADVLDVLRLGTHQLLGMRVPTHAAVSTSVDLAASAAGGRTTGFVNAVLRRVSRQPLEDWLRDLRQGADGQTAALAATESHPAWVVKAMRQALVARGRPEEELAALLAADNSDPEVVLCARPGLVSVEELAREVGAATGQDPASGRLSPCAILLDGGDPGRAGAVRDGRAGVEDEGSQLVALMLAGAALEGPDERWLDMCAGPGGKAVLLGALAAQRGALVVANEVARHRADLVTAAARALPPRVLEVRRGDGREIGAQEPGRYDRVLVDAPCSGLGSLRRRPEARWRRSHTDVAELAALQRELLTSALAAVRPGGVVAYVTCSPHVLETTLVVEDVVRRQERQGRPVEILHAGQVAGATALRPPAAAGDRMLQLWPHLDGTDAMFCALLRAVPASSNGSSSSHGSATTGGSSHGGPTSGSTSGGDHRRARRSDHSDHSNHQEN